VRGANHYFINSAAESDRERDLL
jgi:hypothetical protein